MTLLYFLESLCYSALFLFLSIHHEMASLLTYKRAPDLPISNALTTFWQTCGTLVVVIVTILLCIVSFVLFFLRCKNAQNTSTAVHRAMTAKGIACLLAFPGALFAVLNDSHYSIPILMTLITIQLLVGQCTYILSQTQK